MLHYAAFRASPLELKPGLILKGFVLLQGNNSPGICV